MTDDQGARVAAGTTAAATAVALWGVGNVLAKAIDLGGAALAFHRLWLGTLGTALVLTAIGDRPRLGDLRLAARGGVAFALDVLLFFTAVKLTTVANATVLGALQPALLLVVVGPLFGERVTRGDVGWTAAAIAGVAVVVFGSAGAPAWSPAGDALAVAAMVTWTWYFVVSKQARRHLGAGRYQVSLLAVATVVVAPVALLSGQDLLVADARTWLGVAAMAAVPGSGHLLMNWAHAHVPLGLASLLTLGIPVVSTLGAAVALDEPVVPLQVVGMAVVIAALAVVIRRSTRPVAAVAAAGDVPDGTQPAA